MDTTENQTVTQPDSFGRHWVYVTKAEVLTHPKGALGLAVVACAAWLIVLGAIESYIWLGTSITSVLLGVGLFLSGIGLILRNSGAYLGAVILPIFLVLRLFFNIRMLAGGGNPLLELYIVGNGIVAALVVFYLFEGDRPNFLYRLRYRSYKAEAESK